MKKLSTELVLLVRMQAQRLASLSPEKRSTAQVVQDTCGIQAQDPAAAALAVRARSDGLVVGDVQAARLQERSIIRTWGQRGTLHLLPTEDLGWLLSLLGPVFVRAGERRRKELGLDEALYLRCSRLLRSALTERGPLTRAEIVEHLETYGIRIEGQARPHLLSRAALEGMLCLGPDRSADHTYVLLRDWVPEVTTRKPLSEEAAYAELTRRYLAAYGPATLEDQAAWSGLPVSKTREAWERLGKEMMEVEVAGVPAWMLASDSVRLEAPPTPGPTVRLLPRFDTYLLGYRDRDLAVPRAFAKRINPGGGMVHAAVCADGRIVGTWKSERKKDALYVTVEPFDSLTLEVAAGLEAEAADLGRFLGVKAGLNLSR